MRFLEILSSGDIRLTEKPFDDIPSYAILSHTWGTQEVTFTDMVNDSGRNKIGYDKIKFCRNQAARDALQYFWVDSCCIDKSNSQELQEPLHPCSVATSALLNATCIWLMFPRGRGYSEMRSLERRGNKLFERASSSLGVGRFRSSSLLCQCNSSRKRVNYLVTNSPLSNGSTK
jgi:hypothetical protein